MWRRDDFSGLPFLRLVESLLFFQAFFCPCERGDTGAARACRICDSRESCGGFGSLFCANEFLLFEAGSGVDLLMIELSTPWTMHRECPPPGLCDWNMYLELATAAPRPFSSFHLSPSILSRRRNICCIASLLRAWGSSRRST